MVQRPLFAADVRLCWQRQSVLKLGEWQRHKAAKGRKSGIVSCGNVGLDQLSLHCLGTIRLQSHAMLLRSVAPVRSPTHVARVFEYGYFGWACGKQLYYARLPSSSVRLQLQHRFEPVPSYAGLARWNCVKTEWSYYPRRVPQRCPACVVETGS